MPSFNKSFLNTSVDESLGDKLRSFPVVAQAQPMIFNIMDLTPEVNALVFGWHADSYEFNSLTFASGGRFHDGKPEIILGEMLAGNLNKKVGDTVEIQGSPSPSTESITAARHWKPAPSSCPSISCSCSPACKARSPASMCGLSPLPPGRRQSNI